MFYFLYCSSKALANVRKKPNNPHGGRDSKIKNHWNKTISAEDT